MNCKTEQKQRGSWRAWVAPVLVSVVVFAVLGIAKAISLGLAIGLAVAIIFVGFVALRSF